MISEMTVAEVRRLRDRCEGRFKQLKAARRYASHSYTVAALLWLIYAILAFMDSPQAFARSGAGLVVVATLVSGMHLFTVDRARSCFGFLRTGGMLDNGTKKGGSNADNKARSALFEKMWRNHLDAADLESSLIGLVVRWEVALATVGTFVWGYGDIIRSWLCSIGKGGCANALL